MTMTTSRIALSVLAAGAVCILPAVASAAPNFSGMQLNLLCPDFDGPMGAGNDQLLDATARRVYQGKVIAANPNGAEVSACKKFVKNGKGGWFTARVTWSSDKNPSLYVENTAAWAGSQGDEQHELILFLDGNGNAADFNKVYVDTRTNILNEPGLTISVEVQANAKCEHDKVEKHCVDHHKDRGKCGHDDGRGHSCSHNRGDSKCSHDEDDDNGLCIHEKNDGSDCVHKRGEGGCGHNVVNGKNDDDDGRCHHDRDDGGQCVHDKGDGRCGCDKGDAKHNGGQCVAQWILVNQQRLKPVPWALWAMHSGDSADIYLQLSKLDSRITNINNTSNKYTDDQISELHNHFHMELAAEATARQTGDTQVLQSVNSYTDQLVKSEAASRAQQDTILQQQDTILQKQIDGKVTTVGATWPVTSTGGTNPVIGLAPCKNGEALTYVNGVWTCSSSGAAAGNAVYNRNVASCGQPDVLTAQSGCTFSLPNCVKQADIAMACPQAPAQCVFSQTDTSQVCVSQSFQCDFFGCFPVCDQYETTYCGDCKCDFPKMGMLMK